jgi:hypothetical protein
MISFARDPDPDKDSEPSLHRKRKHGSSTSFFGYPMLLVYYMIIYIPVVPHKAVAEVSKIGNL